MIKDYSRDLDSAALVHTFWALAVGLEIDAWFVFVGTHANIADWPSRGMLDFATDLGAVPIDDVLLPPQERWGSVVDALEHARVDSSLQPPGKRRKR